MEFVALDVETANADMSSICQIGMAHFRGREILGEWKTYVDPEDYFDGINVSIHGIDETTVKGRPLFRSSRIRSLAILITTLPCATRTLTALLRCKPPTNTAYVHRRAHGSTQRA